MSNSPIANDDLRLLIVADNPLARTGLVALLNDQPGFNVVGQVAADGDLLHMLDIYRPAVMVWDLGWEPAATLERLREVRESHYRVVALLPDEDFAANAWRAGANGLLFQNVQTEPMIAAIQAVANGLTVLDPALATQTLESAASTSELPAEALTPRELEVLQLLAQGLTNKAIAQRLAISDHTVKFHVNAIMTKLNAQSRTEAVVRASRFGLILL
ncbi:MAG: response regulator transcription factor [Anaerolineae bacterium]|nr:response regulator transcription factor [Anaerolineae bacterium]